MAEQTIVFAQGIELPPDILAQAQHMKPTGLTLHLLPPAASAAEIAAAIRKSICRPDPIPLDYSKQLENCNN